MRDKAGDVSRGKILMLASLLMELRFAIEGGGDPLKSFRWWGGGGSVMF